MERGVLLLEGRQVLVWLADTLADIVQQLADEVAISLHLKNILNSLKYISNLPRGRGKRWREGKYGVMELVCEWSKEEGISACIGCTSAGRPRSYRCR